MTGIASSGQPHASGDHHLASKRDEQEEDAGHNQFSNKAPGTLRPNPDKFARAIAHARDSDKDETNPKKVVEEHRQAEEDKKGSETESKGDSAAKPPKAEEK